MHAGVTDGIVDAAGVSLHIHCVGQGTPVVVFESGLGNDGSVWGQVQPDVGSITQACVYDRAGTGYSGPGPKPRTSRQMVSELHALLTGAGIRGPYVLVGHSLGGLNVRLFASEFPSEASGMVLVDSMAADQDTRFWALLLPEKLREFQAGVSNLPGGIDFEALRQSMAEVRASNQSFGDKPLVVLTHGRDDPPEPGDPPDLGPRMGRVWGEMQAELPQLSSNSVQIVATNSRHFIQIDAPKLVSAAVVQVVRAARTHTGLESGPLQRLAGEGASP